MNLPTDQDYLDEAYAEIATMRQQLAEAKAATAHESDCCESYKTESASLRETLAEKDAEIAQLEADKDDAEDGPWEDWAEQILKTVRKHTGYDGFDDANGVDLPTEVSEALSEYEIQITRVEKQLAKEKAGWAAANMHALTFGLERDEATIRSQQFEVENGTLCRQLAESQAREAKLREALDAVQQVANRSEGIAGWHLNGDIASWDSILPEVEHALTLPQDDTALRQMIEKAGEVMRERNILFSKKDGWILPSEIRAIPGVTLEDLQG